MDRYRAEDSLKITALCFFRQTETLERNDDVTPYANGRRVCTRQVRARSLMEVPVTASALLSEIKANAQPFDVLRK